MTGVRFKIERSLIMASTDVADVDDGEDVGTALGVAVLNALSIDVEVTAGGVTLHLAAWLDPEHWSSDWQAKGIDDGRAFIAGLARERV